MCVAFPRHKGHATKSDLRWLSHIRLLDNFVQLKLTPSMRTRRIKLQNDSFCYRFQHGDSNGTFCFQNLVWTETDRNAYGICRNPWVHNWWYVETNSRIEQKHNTNGCDAISVFARNHDRQIIDAETKCDRNERKSIRAKMSVGGGGGGGGGGVIKHLCRGRQKAARV